MEHWEDAARKNIGLLLFGDVGTGKSFLAGCIANALLEQDVPVLMTNFPTILNRMTGLFGSERADFPVSYTHLDVYKRQEYRKVVEAFTPSFSRMPSPSVSTQPASVRSF